MDQQNCPKCGYVILSSYYFCPNCGKKLKEPPAPTGIGTQIGIYAICIFLPPFGLAPAIRYLLQKDLKAIRIGIVALILTIISTIITVWLTITTINNINATLNQQFRGLGY